MIAVIAGLQWLIAAPQLGDAALLIALYGVALRGSVVELALAAIVIEAGRGDGRRASGRPRTR